MQGECDTQKKVVATLLTLRRAKQLYKFYNFSKVSSTLGENIKFSSRKPLYKYRVLEQETINNFSQTKMSSFSSSTSRLRLFLSTILRFMIKLLNIFSLLMPSDTAETRKYNIFFLLVLVRQLCILLVNTSVACSSIQKL